MSIALILIVIAAGAGLTLQAVVNSRLRAEIGQPALSALISFLVGLAVLWTVYLTGWMGKAKEGGYAHAPWWAWIGGIFGAAYVTVAIIAVPRIGTAALTCGVVCGQLIAALIFDSLGLLGASKIELNAPRIVGAVLLILGVLLMQRK